MDFVIDLFKLAAEEFMWSDVTFFFWAVRRVDGSDDDDDDDRRGVGSFIVKLEQKWKEVMEIFSCTCKKYQALIN